MKMADKYIYLYGIRFAGKTCILETLKQNKTIIEAKPTLAINMDRLEINELVFKVWDTPGQPSLLRLTWTQFKNMGLINATEALIFILDTADEENFKVAKEEFLEVLNDKACKGKDLIFCFHKMDLQEAKDNLQEAKDLFDLNSIKKRMVYVVETSVKTLDSICELKNKLYSLSIANI